MIPSGLSSTVPELLNTTIHTYPKCVIHLVDFEGLLDNQIQPSVPLIIDNWASRIHQWKRAIKGGSIVFRNLSEQLEPELEFTIKSRMSRNNSRVLKIRNFICFITFLLASDLETFSIRYTMGPIHHVVRTCLHQDFTFGIHLPWLMYINPDLKPLRFFPQSLS